MIQELSVPTQSVPVVAKIEKPKAVDNIDGIIEATDAIMVARGDLGIETSPEAVPIVQKMIIAKCTAVGKPVITATQMLDSMMRNPRPTRAEASDVANAIFDGTDAIMLSGETAVGKYPLESVRTMARIAGEAERSKLESVARPHPPHRPVTSIASAISHAPKAMTRWQWLCCSLPQTGPANNIPKLTAKTNSAMFFAVGSFKVTT